MANNKLDNEKNHNLQSMGQNGLSILSGTATAAGVIYGVIHITSEASVTATNNCGFGDSFSGTTLPAGYYYGRFTAVSISGGSGIAYKLAPNS